MEDIDENFKIFSRAYSTKKFDLAGSLVYQIISTLPGQEYLPADDWQYKFSELMGFLHQTRFSFDSSDSFYEMLATIALQIRKNPNVGWKDILN